MNAEKSKIVNRKPVLSVVEWIENRKSKIILPYYFDLSDFLRSKPAVINPIINPIARVERIRSIRGIVIDVKRNFVSTCCLF
jgi:hypothetical protein